MWVLDRRNLSRSIISNPLWGFSNHKRYPKILCGLSSNHVRYPQILCCPCSCDLRFFLVIPYIFSITRGFLKCLLGFWPLGQSGGNKPLSVACISKDNAHAWKIVLKGFSFCFPWPIKCLAWSFHFARFSAFHLSNKIRRRISNHTANILW